jgi:hypothetical protein
MNLKDDDLVSAVALVVDTGDEAEVAIVDGDVDGEQGPEQDGPAVEES